ncbi:MAG: hypothetical protein ACE5DX_02960 [Candidatus Dojkabacteria bacterium]
MPAILGREMNPNDVPEVDELTFTETLKGTAFGFLGGYLMTIPWIVVSYFGWFVGILGYLIGIGALYGFIFGSQKLHKSAIPVIIAVILTALPIAEFVGIAIAFVQNGVLPHPLSVISFALSPEYSGSLVTNLLVGYFIAGWGVWSLVRGLRNSEVQS